jgi:methionine synthase I (cobalamin-dependent)
MLLEQKETASSMVDVVRAEGNSQLIGGCCWSRRKQPAQWSMLLEQKETARSMVNVVRAEGNSQLIGGCCCSRRKPPAH